MATTKTVTAKTTTTMRPEPRVARAKRSTPPAPTPPSGVQNEVPKPGVLLRSYRFSLRSIEGTGVTVGSNALAGLRLAGLPKTFTKKLQNGQSKALGGVTGWSDDVGTKVAHGIGTGKVLAKEGAKKSAKAWTRGMKFFITLK